MRYLPSFLVFSAVILFGDSTAIAQQIKKAPTLAEVPRVSNFAYSPDGSFILLQDAFDTLGIWETKTGKLRVKLAQKTARSWDCIAVAPDGKKTAAINFVGRLLQIWDAASGEV